MPEVRRIVPLLAIVASTACDSGSTRPVDVRTTSISPAPDALAVSRRVQVRATFDQDVDPSSCIPANCYLELPGQGRVAADIAYAPATRLLTLTPTQALDPLTTYRVQLTRNLRAASGAPFATAAEWTFTTDDELVWDRSFELATGKLLACEPSRTGGALALWAAADGELQFARFDGSTWSPAVAVDLQNVRQAAVADDSAGNVVVAATTQSGNLFLARRAVGEWFQLPELVGGQITGKIDVDTDSGHIVVAADSEFAATSLGTWIRTWILGIGWTTPYLTLTAKPRVHVDATGQGTVVCGFDRIEPFVSATPWCERFCIDALGNVSACDPRPAVPNSVASASKAVFGEAGRIVTAQTVETTTGSEVRRMTLVFQWRPLVGWQQLPQLLGSDPNACDIAVGPGQATAMATIAEGLRPIVWIDSEVWFVQDLLGSSEEPAPPNPTTAVAITRESRYSALWTAAVDASPGSPVRLLAAQRTVIGPWGEALVVDGPFAAEAVPVQTLRVVAVGNRGAVAVWSRHGTVRCSTLR